MTCILTNDRAGTTQTVKPTIAHVIGGAPAEVLVAIGLDPAVVERVKRTYHASGPVAAAPHVTDDAVDQLAIIGDGPCVVDRIRMLARHNVTQVVVLLPGRGPESSHSIPRTDHQALLRRFADTMITQL